ncbi:MAG: hypothetical protein ACXVNM_07415 [Bacteroidia bacterium]
MKNFIGFSLLFFLPVCFSAQTDKKTNSVNSNQSGSVAKADTLKKSPTKATSFTEGTIPSPEEQGFTKETINGKDVYFKNSNGIRIQYQPN